MGWETQFLIHAVDRETYSIPFMNMVTIMWRVAISRTGVTEQPVSSNGIFLSMKMKSGGIASYPIHHTGMLKRWHGKR
ncbi:hypothetical protein [Commensalibacter melissae]|uniref:hypothetical protein n=1 Tax=Commensalibacter melissae TaxID=2070537 RepID=UPI0018C25D52|nr:hypothetical protein [Commensalibacter melissae]